MTKRFLTIAVLALSASGAQADKMNMPGQISWSAYDMGSTGYNQTVAIGSALKNGYGTNLRILPGKNDVSRAEPLRQGKVDFSAAGVGGVYLAQEAVFEFNAPNWGPQKVRVLLQNAQTDSGFALAVARDACAKVGKPDCEGFTYADLRGQRVADVKGAPAITLAVEAFMAYGGLTWDDVERVEFGGYGSALKALNDGDIDATYSNTTAGGAYEAASGPRGLYWPQIDPENVEGIARLQKVAPYFAPAVATGGAGIDPAEGLPTVVYPYPILVAMADQDEDLVYMQTRAMVEQFDAYDGKAPGINGWKLSAQKLEWLVPFHKGAIRYFNEVGVWNDKAQAHNDRLVERQELLVKTWDELKAEGPANWEAAWMEKRRQVLIAADFEPVF